MTSVDSSLEMVHYIQQKIMFIVYKLINVYNFELNNPVFSSVLERIKRLREITVWL